MRAIQQVGEAPAVLTKGLVKEFVTRSGAVKAVDRMDLEVSRGETFGLIGPDGAGKTTTIRVILGLLRRTDGYSSVLGYDSMGDTYRIRDRTGYIAQQFALPPDLTVLENMRFFGQIHGVDRPHREQRIPELLEFAGLREFTSRLAGNLSGGMKKKLALTCSLVHEPAVVLLDEPTLGVDPVSRREFWDLLGNLRSEKGLTVFVCTPYMDEAERCTKVGLMYQGRLVAADTPQAIKRQVPGRLLELRPSRFVAAWHLIKGMDSIFEVQPFGAMLHVFADDPEVRRAEIEAMLSAHGIDYDGMRETEPTMEDAFISMIRRQRQDGED
jgi:ABC-2 type transport system ATP-binding protein